MTRRIGWVVCVLSLLGSGCAEETEAPPPDPEFLGICDKIESDSRCVEYVGEPDTDKSGDCEAIGGSFATAVTCPTDDRLGRCEISSSDGELTTTHFYRPDYYYDLAEAACLSFEGNWLPDE